MTTFYKNFLRLCEKEQKSPCGVATELGFNKSANTAWSKGSLPKLQNRQRIADYFFVSVDDLFNVDMSDSENRTAEQIRLTKEEAELINSWRKADEYKKNIISAVLSPCGFKYAAEKEIIGVVR